MPESLNQIIARLSDRDADQAAGDVEQIVSDIRRVLDEEGTCTIEGLGTFLQDEGRVRFEASGDLLRAVNAVWEDRETFSVSHVDRDAAPSTGPAVQYDDEVEDGELDAPDDSEVIVSTPVSELESTADDDSSEETASEEVVAASVGVSDPDGGAEGAQSDAPAGEAKPTAPRRSLRESRNPRHRRRADATRSNSRMPIIIAAGDVVILAAAAIIFWPAVSPTDDGMADQTALDTTTAADTIADSAAVAAAADTTATAGTDAPQTAETPATPPDETPEQVPAAETPVADTGTLDRNSDGYTLIVASSLDEQSANRRIQPFAELGMPYGVLAYAQDDTTRFRLAVGQFSSAAAADSVRQAMADQLPAGTWVWRIR